MGFVWDLGNGISADEFFDHLKDLKDKPIPFGGFDRLIYVGSREDYFIGLFIKLKDQRRSAEIIQDGGQFTVTVRELEEGKNLIDFNFFVINKSTMRGLYQHYHQSCSLNQFGIFCARQYDDLRDSKIEEEVKSIGDNISASQRRQIQSRFKGSLTWQNMVRSEALEQLLEELDIIKYFDFTLATIDDNDSLLTPLSPYAKRNRRIVRFKSVQKGLAGTLVSLVKSKRITVGKIGGVDAEKRERVFRLIENPGKFGEYEYDDLANETVLNLKDVDSSPFFDEMLDIIQDDAELKAIFESPAK
ncbi:hypothetical protein B7486_07930 [cyanobacterium TDX16]|nr:hypothetical protein B7486_07930 [cyanobacterium TDX16]